MKNFTTLNMTIAFLKHMVLCVLCLLSKVERNSKQGQTLVFSLGILLPKKPIKSIICKPKLFMFLRTLSFMKISFLIISHLITLPFLYLSTYLPLLFFHIILHLPILLLLHPLNLLMFIPLHHPHPPRYTTQTHKPPSYLQQYICNVVSSSCPNVLHFPEPHTYKTTFNNPCWVQAMETELNALKFKNT